MKLFSPILYSVAAFFLVALGNHALANSDSYRDSINLAVNRWLDVQKPSGFLPYGFNFLENEEFEPNTMSAANLTRQTGAAAVLADYYALTKDKRAQPAIERFLSAFGRYSLPIGKSRIQALVETSRLLSLPIGRYKLQAMLERFGLLYETNGSGKVLSPNTDYSKAYTGSVALALLTELRYSQTSGDNRYADLRQAWLEGLLGLRIPGDGFRQIPTSIDATPYFDGEAWLALAQYHRAFPQEQHVNNLLSDVDSALMKKYGDEFQVAFFHWGMMAAAARYSDTRDPKFLGFIKTQTSAFLNLKKGRTSQYNTCAFDEGVADALGALQKAGEGDGKLAKQAMDWIVPEMEKAKQMQIQPGQSALVFAHARIIAPRMQEFAGSFRSGIYSADTQVDFTGHCLSAMVKMARWQIQD